MKMKKFVTLLALLSVMSGRIQQVAADSESSINIVMEKDKDKPAPTPKDPAPDVPNQSKLPTTNEDVPRTSGTTKNLPSTGEVKRKMISAIGVLVLLNVVFFVLLKRKRRRENEE